MVNVYWRNKGRSKGVWVGEGGEDSEHICMYVEHIRERVGAKEEERERERVEAKKRA